MDFQLTDKQGRSLRSEIESEQGVIEAESRRTHRLKQNLKIRKKALREELRYYEEMAVLSRHDCPILLTPTVNLVNPELLTVYH